MHNNRSEAAPQVASTSPTKAGWRVDEWTFATGLSRGSFYKLLKAGKVEIVKAGKATIIVTSPAEYLASLRGEAA
jgi:hypothetical protein